MSQQLIKYVEQQVAEEELKLRQAKIKSEGESKKLSEEDIEKRLVEATNIPNFAPGDTINVHVLIREGNKERIQQFQGTVIQRRNSGHNGETFTVRKVSGSIGVERIFPILSPNIAKIEVLRKGKVRRARLFYLRDRKGKAAKIKEKRY